MIANLRGIIPLSDLEKVIDAENSQSLSEKKHDVM